MVESAEECDLLVGTGPDAPTLAVRQEVPLIWDGDSPSEGVAVWGASPSGLTLALAAREEDPRLIAVAHPDAESGSDHVARFPDPIGNLDVADSTYAGHRIAVGKSPNDFAACLAIGAGRRVTIVDDAPFLSGVCLAAGVAVAGDKSRPVWEGALDYLRLATEMGLVMAEDV